MAFSKSVILSIVIPCYNEEKTLNSILDRVLEIREKHLKLEIIIVDDGSKDNSLAIAHALAQKHKEIHVIAHEKNQGKGAALQTGFQHASGDYVCIQDADLEYDPHDLKRLLVPLIEDKADAVIGSRFLSYGAHRVLYFWHSIGNQLLTLLSNMFTDLNLTDMESCYKVFRADVVKAIDLKEKRFGVEPELVAKLAHMRLRIYEMGISYFGRTYEEGKKIGLKDGFRALYCIIRYNGSHAPLPIQFVIYFFIGAAAALVNLGLFLIGNHFGLPIEISAPAAFILAAIVNYLLCIWILFRHKARWNTTMEMIIFLVMVGVVCVIDLYMTKSFLLLKFSPAGAKFTSTAIGFILNFLGRRFLVFPEPKSGPWRKQVEE